MDTHKVNPHALTLFRLKHRLIPDSQKALFCFLSLIIPSSAFHHH